MVHEIENFYGVYLLYSLNPKFKGRTYIGFTVNPNRRLKQHNGGIQAGGAKRTNGRGPWDMVLIVHGFPNMISALRFEWAWTKPKISRRLRQLPAKKSKETAFLYCIRVMCSMLRTGPWDRLPLSIRWLKQEYMVNFDPMILPPSHMPIVFGPVKSKKVKSKPQKREESSSISVQRVCSVCQLIVECTTDEISCLACHIVSHIVCLGRLFLDQQKESQTQLMPIEGVCPSCRANVLWGDLIRYKSGCYRHSSELQSQDSSMSDEDDDI